MTSKVQIAAAPVVGLLLVLGVPIDAMAASDNDAVSSRLTVGGQKLAALLRAEPMMPVAFEAGFARLEPRGSGESRGQAGSAHRGNRRKSVLIGGAIGGGTGAYMGYAVCANESGRNCPYSALGGLLGAAIGVVIGIAVSK